MTIKEMRTLLGLTQQAFADKYGIPKRNIENWEGGKNDPPKWAQDLLERAVFEDVNKEERTMKLTIIYKNGNQLEQLVNYVHLENGAIYYTMNKQVHGTFQEPVRIPIENIDKFDVEEA